MPRPGSSAEDDGWLLVLVFASASERTELAILDAQKLSQGPVATIQLPHHIPPGGRTFPTSAACLASVRSVPFVHACFWAGEAVQC